MSVIAVVEHEAACPPAHFGRWLAAAGATLRVHRPYLGEDLPEAGSYTGLVVLGGSMGANDDADHHWLEPTRKLMLDAADRGLPALGICLGHQLAAVAFGGEVERNPAGQQFGLFPMGWTAEATTDPLFAHLTTRLCRGVQWNDDIVSRLPDDAVLLATHPNGQVQAARFAPTVWGVQVHPEVDAQILAPWADADRVAHAARGVDTDAVLAQIDAARAELDAAWQPLAAGFLQHCSP